MLSTIPATFRSGLLQREAASALGVSVRTLHNWQRTGFGPQPIRDAGRLLYDGASIEAFKAGVR